MVSESKQSRLDSAALGDGEQVEGGQEMEPEKEGFRSRGAPLL